MAFERFEYTKTWKDPAAFPAYEPDETRVRADLQCLHDEAKDAVNRLVDALNDASAAAQLPFAPVEGMQAQTVQAAIEEVFGAVTDAAAAKIVNGSVTKEKLEEQLLKRIYGGRVWASMGAPTVSDNPGTGFPVGQIWLRPAMTLENLAADEWTVEGGTAEAQGSGWVFAADGSRDYIKAAQELVTNGVPGQRVMIRLVPGDMSRDPEMSLSLNDLETEIEEDGIYETELDGAGRLELVLRGSASNGSEALEIVSLTAVNLGALEAQFPDHEAREDWTAELEKMDGCARHHIPMKVWLQTSAGQWEEIACDTLPVSRGGTGLTAVAEGALLYGTGAGALAALPPAENGILQWTGGRPQWVEPEALAESCGYLRVTSGSYEGTGGNGDRTMELPVTPVVLFLWPKDGSGDTVCLTNGGRNSGTYSFYDGVIVSYEAWAALAGTILTFSNQRYGNLAGRMLSQHMNAEGVSYCWLAVH